MATRAAPGTEIRDVRSVVLHARPIEPGDADALGRLYEGLTPDDRLHRSLSAYHPRARS